MRMGWGRAWHGKERGWDKDEDKNEGMNRYIQWKAGSKDLVKQRPCQAKSLSSKDLVKQRPCHAKTSSSKERGRRKQRRRQSTN